MQKAGKSSWKKKAIGIGLIVAAVTGGALISTLAGGSQSYEKTAENGDTQQPHEMKEGT